LKTKAIFIYFTVLILYYYISICRCNHVSGDKKGDKFDRELFEPTHNGEDGDEGGMESSHGLHNENLYDDDGIIHQHAQGTTTTSIRHLQKSRVII
jgi:hypothetical protein